MALACRHLTVPNANPHRRRAEALERERKAAEQRRRASFANYISDQARSLECALEAMSDDPPPRGATERAREDDLAEIEAEIEAEMDEVLRVAQAHDPAGRPSRRDGVPDEPKRVDEAANEEALLRIVEANAIDELLRLLPAAPRDACRNALARNDYNVDRAACDLIVDLDPEASDTLM